MQQIAILSINHQVAPVEIREKVAFSTAEIVASLNDLKKVANVKAGIILSTCNRSEIIVAFEGKNIQESLSKYLADAHNLEPQTLKPYLQFVENNAAISHLCEVASGLNSQALGEPQIFGQLKESYNLSKKNQTLNKLLEKLLQFIFATAKKVRTQTKIGASPISIAYCAVKLSEKIFTDLSSQTALLIGAGETVELCASHLKQRNIKSIIIANRTQANAAKIATKYAAKAISLAQYPDLIHQADIIISSTAASVPIIGKGLIETALKARKHKPIFILDIAVPRDVEPEVATLDDVFLYTIDDLKATTDDNLKNRQKEKILALEIIKKEVQKFANYQVIADNDELIKTYQQQTNTIKSAALEKAHKKLKKGISTTIVLQELAEQLTNKLLHEQITNLKNSKSYE